MPTEKSWKAEGQGGLRENWESSRISEKAKDSQSMTKRQTLHYLKTWNKILINYLNHKVETYKGTEEGELLTPIARMEFLVR